MNHRIQGLIFAGMSLLIGIQSGSPSSVDCKERPAVNIIGTLQDTNGKVYSLEYITIGGRYAQIPLYQKPESIDQNPEINTTKIDLIDVDEIRMQEPPQILSFNKRDYIEIRVLFKGDRRTQNNYIIERTKEVRAEELLGNGTQRTLDHEFKFLAIKSLRISGTSQKQCQRQPEESCIEDFHDLTITKTRKLIDEIEQTAQRIPEQSSPAAHGLKAQLLYLVDELKKTFMHWFA